MDIAGPRTLYGELRRHARRSPDAPWLAFEDEAGGVRTWSWAELVDDVHRTAAELHDLGLREGAVIALAMRNHPLFVRIVLAGSLRGLTVLPVNPAAPADEMRYYLTHAGVELLVADQEVLAGAQGAAAGAPRTRLVMLREEFEARASARSAADPGVRCDAASTLQLLYTSGTTSRPKGVMLTDANFIYGSEVFRAATGLRPDDHHLIALPLFHAAAQCHALWPSLVTGGRVTLLPRFSASGFFRQAVRHRATMAALFGAPLRMLLNQPEQAGDRAHALRNVTFAQSLSPDQYARWHARFGAPLQQLWGMTETCSLPVMSPLYGERRLEAMGRPVVGYEVRVVDGDGRDAAQGELIVRGEPGRSLMRGYRDNPAATAETLRTGPAGTWLHSGDNVRVDEDGFLHFIDRGKDLIKRAGENISCTEVEGVLAQHPGVRDVCVTALPDPVRDELVAAAVVRVPGVALDAAALRAWCEGRMVAFKIPERIVFVDELPRTSVGKVQRGLVRQQCFPA